MCIAIVPDMTCAGTIRICGPCSRSGPSHRLQCRPGRNSCAAACAIANCWIAMRRRPGLRPRIQIVTLRACLAPSGTWVAALHFDHCGCLPGSAARVPFEGPKGVMHESREIHRSLARFRPVGPVARAARGPPAIRPRTSAEGAARRPRRARGGPDRPLRRALARGAERGRGGAGEAPQGGGRRGRAALSRSGARARVRRGRKGRREGGRQLCDGRAAAARPGAREGQRGRPDPEQGRRDAAEPQCGDQCAAQGAHRRHLVGRERL